MSESTEWREGYVASNRGDSKLSNPYLTSAQFWHARDEWDLGWEAAQFDIDNED